MIKKIDVIELKNAREALAFEKALADEIRNDHAETFTAEREAKDRIKRAEEMLRGQALAEHLETGNKKLTFGLGIRESSGLSYDPGRALEFAKEKDLFLTLDVKGFEAAAANLKLDWVDVIRKVTATIPKEIKFYE